MKKVSIESGFVLITLLLGCTGSDDEITPNPDPIFFNLTLDGKEYSLESTNYVVSQGSLRSGCVESTPWVGGFSYGVRPTHLMAKDVENSFIKEVRFGITQKVGIIDLNLANELNYMEHVLDRSGESGFPTEIVGYEPIRNFVDFPTSEVYLEVYMNDGNLYSSTLEGLSERDESSFFRDTRILNLGEAAPAGYSYILEANFKVDLYKNNASTNSLLVEGNFRLPIYTFKTSEAKAQCN